MKKLKKTKKNRWSAIKKPNSVATSVVNVTPRPATYPDTNKPIEAWILIRPKSATRAAKRTCPCQLWPCTCSPTNWLTVATFAANNSRDRGFFRDICVLTLEKSPTDARTAAKRSQTGQFNRRYTTTKLRMCWQTFRSNLRAHMQTHSDEKRFECSHCFKSFALKSYLNKHMESTCMNYGGAGKSKGNQARRNAETQTVTGEDSNFSIVVD